MDFQNVESVGIQIAHDSRRIWVCVDGACVLRAGGIKTLKLEDCRICSRDGEVEIARQRDELLATLEEAVRCLDRASYPESGYTGRTIKRCQMVIANVEAADV